MSTIKDGGSAFPVLMKVGDVAKSEAGMSLRDWFAGQIMIGMTASPALMEVVTAGDIRDGDAFDRMALKAYRLADAMLAAREGGAE